MTRAEVIHRVEYFALSLFLVGAAIAAKDQLGWAFWLFLLAPDLFGLVPAALMGRAPARGYVPPRGVWLYNVWHTRHISVDRFLGFGLRGDDGGPELV